MSPSHRVTFYRHAGKGAALPEDPPPRSAYDREEPAPVSWRVLAPDVPATLQFLSGAIRLNPAGREVDATARLYVHPRDLPAGVEIDEGDAVVVTSGRCPPPGRFVVVHAAPQGPRAGRFDDEVLLNATPEEIR